MTRPYTLYGAYISNYSGKVRSYLLYKQIPFQEVVASNAIYDKLLVPAIGFRMMPVLRAPDGEWLQDSTDIIDHLEARFTDVPIYPSTPRQHLAALLLEAYAHDWVRIPAMYYRWAFPAENHDYLIREFGRMYEPIAHPDRQAAIGEESSAWTRDRLPSLGVTANTIPAFEAWTMNLLGWLDAHFSKHSYLLGERPSTADFALMGPFFGHLYRDPHSGAMLRREAPQVVAWVERMTTSPPPAGDYLSGDEVPDTLLPLLRHALAEYAPVAYDTIQRVGAWIDENPGAPIPRFLGTQTFSIAGVSETRTVWTCIQYMMQRPLALYQASEGPARAAMDSLLAQIGAPTGLDFSVRRPVRRRNFQLVAES
jgi:glutathione S-transferase